MAQPELSYNPYAHLPGYAEDVYGGIYHGEFEDCNEVSTRPRLTKDQVDILEHEFQKNPKPNSMLKRNLAATTNLHPQRVANWFQNRRAKAKQQRKQEEFEHQQSKDGKQTPSQGPASDEDEDEEYGILKQEEDNLHTTTRPRSTAAAASSNAVPSPPRSPKSESLSTDVRDRAHASLQRAIAAAQAAQYKATLHPTSVIEHIPEMSPAFAPQGSASSLDLVTQAQIPHQSQMQHGWSDQGMNANQWTCSPGAAGDMTFDFGFNKSEPQLSVDNARMPSSADSASHGMVSPQAWGSDLSTPTMSMASQNHFQQPLASPGMQMTSYVGGRRGSIAEALTDDFEGIAPANATPSIPFQPLESVSPDPSEGVDIASRRRRPRPAALTSASLRSRSYGALTAASPTFRQGMTPPAGHALRHVKSTGHSLNNHYPGVRKSSIPYRSPLNFSTFAESEAFRELMAQKAAEDAVQQQMTPTNTIQMSYAGPHEPMVRSLSQMVHSNATSTDLPSRSQVHSPPVTPFHPDFYLRTSSMMAQPIQSQYASFADYTPPHSARPLTNSSWSDAPLTSPDLANFPAVNMIPSLSYGGLGDEQNNMPYMLSTEQSSYLQTNTPTESKKTEFFLQEFPNQKEEHARAAKLLDHPRPKHYAFDNKGQRDYLRS
ncbi:hypothetical protein LTR70_006542 [Exophiala xenobiotica]|uniref:Homeobox domain-containing protein n=1 Tax=Lithohypha guttulata TaxID=1690604 RepID=A0ABR0K774_9EURO|nr:hypothetical protein LTR24_006016 [Lithohypha guttulata]KAK5315900.1 hypothetical protein LTR70_006542 [Exophiala xenobiotica]